MRPGPKPTHPSERFWTKVEKHGPDGCWIWTGSKSRDGYGFLHAGPLYYSGTRWVKAHRLSWEMAYDERAGGDCILHHCDNPSCVNPKHLYLGDRADNAADRGDRKRGREHRQNGEHNSNAKLTEDQVREFIAELQKLPRRSISAIGRDFGISQAQASKIACKKSWAHLWDE